MLQQRKKLTVYDCAIYLVRHEGMIVMLYFTLNFFTHGRYGCFFYWAPSALSHSPRRSEQCWAKLKVANKKVPAYRQRRVEGIPNGA